MQVGAARDDPVASLFAPGIGLVLVDNAVHGLVVGGPVECFFFLEIADVQFHLLEFTELGEPSLGLINHHEVADLEGVLAAQDVEVGLVSQDMVVERTLRGRRDSWPVLGLVGIVEAGLEKSTCSHFHLQGRILMKQITSDR